MGRVESSFLGQRWKRSGHLEWHGMGQQQSKRPAEKLRTAHPLKLHPAAIAALSNRAAKIKHNNNRGGKSGNCFDNTLAASMVN